MESLLTRRTTKFSECISTKCAPYEYKIELEYNMEIKLIFFVRSQYQVFFRS